MLNLNPATRVFVCSQVIDMRYSFDALSGLVTSHFGKNPLNGHIFVFFSRRRDRMKLLFWDADGFVLYYKRLERGTFSWIQDLDLDTGGEIQASDFALILAGINPSPQPRKRRKEIVTAPLVTPSTPPLQPV
jgi:transposase